MDLVLFDTRVDYEAARSRSHITLSSSPRLQDLRQELLEACEREGEQTHTCYEMDVELESPTGDEDEVNCISGSSSRFRHQEDIEAPRYPRHSSVGNVFRALKCIEGEDLMQDEITMTSLEVTRLPRPGHRAPPGYVSLNRGTIDY